MVQEQNRRDAPRTLFSVGQIEVYNLRVAGARSGFPAYGPGIASEGCSADSIFVGLNEDAYLKKQGDHLAGKTQICSPLGPGTISHTWCWNTSKGMLHRPCFLWARMKNHSLRHIRLHQKATISLILLQLHVLSHLVALVADLQ